MKNQRGFISPIFGLVLVIIVAVVLIGRNAATSSNIAKYKTESNERDMLYTLESVSMAMADTSGIEFDTNTDMVDTSNLEVEIKDYINVIDIENPHRLMLTSNLDGNKFNKNDSKYEVVSSMVYKNLNLTLYPSNKDIVNNKYVGGVGSATFSFQSNVGTKFSQVNIGGEIYHKERPEHAKEGPNVATHSESDSVYLNDYEGIKLLYPVEVGDELVQGSYNLK